MVGRAYEVREGEHMGVRSWLLSTLFLHISQRQCLVRLRQWGNASHFACVWDNKRPHACCLALLQRKEGALAPSAAPAPTLHPAAASPHPSAQIPGARAAAGAGMDLALGPSPSPSTQQAVSLPLPLPLPAQPIVTDPKHEFGPAPDLSLYRCVN